MFATQHADGSGETHDTSGQSGAPNNLRYRSALDETVEPQELIQQLMYVFYSVTVLGCNAAEVAARLRRY